MNSVKNANSQSHEWLGEINHLLPLGSNGEACHGQVRFLEGTERARQWGGQVRCGDRDLWPEVVTTGEMSLWSGFSAWGVLIHLGPEHHSRKDTGAEAGTQAHLRADASKHISKYKQRGPSRESQNARGEGKPAHRLLESPQ